MSGAIPSSGKPERDPKPITLVDSRDDGPDDRDIEVVLVALRQMFEDELARSERLKSQARQAFGVAVGFFALAQTVALGSFQIANLNGEHERRVTLLLAAISAVAMVGTGILALFADRGIPARHLDTDSVLAAGRDATYERPAAMELAEQYATAVDAIRDGIQNRINRVYWAQGAAGVTLSLVLIEIVYSLYHRLS